MLSYSKRIPEVIPKESIGKMLAGALIVIPEIEITLISRITKGIPGGYLCDKLLQKLRNLEEQPSSIQEETGINPLGNSNEISR